MNRVLNLAVFTEEIAHSPLPRGWLPKKPRPDSIAKESLLPSEEAKLLVGLDAEGKVVVPLVYRVLYAYLDREGMRKGRRRGSPVVTSTASAASSRSTLNKTDRPRYWVLDPGMAAVLGLWLASQGDARPPPRRCSPASSGSSWRRSTGRTGEAVGIDRARLYERKANKLQLRAHDMRAFFITAAMYAGKDALWITDRTGHTSLGMLRTYERDVRRWRELGEAPVDAAVAIPEIAAAFWRQTRRHLVMFYLRNVSQVLRNAWGLGDKDSNLDKRSQNPLSCR